MNKQQKEIVYLILTILTIIAVIVFAYYSACYIDEYKCESHAGETGLNWKVQNMTCKVEYEKDKWIPFDNYKVSK